MNTLGIDIESTKLARKLRVVAKHAEALADELDAIDECEQCPECNSLEVIISFDGKGGNVSKCEDCGCEFNPEVPTRLEGSE